MIRSIEVTIKKVEIVKINNTCGIPRIIKLLCAKNEHHKLLESQIVTVRLIQYIVIPLYSIRTYYQWYI